MTYFTNDQEKLLPRKALLIIDVQDIYLKKYRNTDFIHNINIRTAAALKNNVPVIYIQNAGIYKSNGPEYKLNDFLQIVSDNIFTKKKPDALSNPKLLSFLQEKRIEELELAGIDGAICIFHSARGAIANGFRVYIAPNCVGFLNEKSQKKMEELKDIGVNMIATGKE